MSTIDAKRTARAMMTTSTAGRSSSTHPATLAARRNVLNGTTNAHGRRWGGDRNRGKLPIPARADPLVRRLFQEMNRQQANIAEVAQRAGMKPATISDWRYRRSPNVAMLQAALNAVGMKLAVVPEGSKL